MFVNLTNKLDGEGLAIIQLLKRELEDTKNHYLPIIHGENTDQ
jgi:hypothetical protein